MVDYDNLIAGHEPDNEDMKRDKRVKLTILGVMFIVMAGIAIYMDVTGQVSSWR